METVYRNGRTLADRGTLEERARCLRIIKTFEFLFESQRVDGSGGEVDPEASRTKLMNLIEWPLDTTGGERRGFALEQCPECGFISYKPEDFAAHVCQ